MSYVNVGRENSEAIELYYEDRGDGKSVVLIDGYALSGTSWEKQVPASSDRFVSRQLLWSTYAHPHLLLVACVEVSANRDFHAGKFARTRLTMRPIPITSPASSSPWTAAIWRRGCQVDTAATVARLFEENLL